MKYYKLLKDLPDVKAGAIFEWNEGYSYEYYWEKETNRKYDADLVKENKEWFEPCLFISEDGEPIFNDDRVHLLYKDEITSGKATKYGFDGQLLPYPASDCLWFKSKQKAEEYIESLKPKFKVGDIVVILKEYKINEPVTIINKVEKTVEYFYYTDYSEIGFNDGAIRKATEQEIIQYYQSQGWVKGAKYKVKKDTTIYTLEKLQIFPVNGCFVFNDLAGSCHINYCELIKEPELPKSWLELNINQKKSINGILPPEVVAYRQLKDLVKVMNGDWIPDWGNLNQKKYFIRREKGELGVRFGYYYFVHLVFQTEALAKFSLEHHRKLWEDYYEL